jgi:hypothetical protein
VTTIWFWMRSVLVTDRFWRIGAHPRDGHQFVDGRTRRRTCLSLVLRSSVSRDGHWRLAVAVRLCSGAEGHGRRRARWQHPGSLTECRKTSKLTPLQQWAKQQRGWTQPIRSYDIQNTLRSSGEPQERTPSEWRHSGRTCNSANPSKGKPASVAPRHRADPRRRG